MTARKRFLSRLFMDAGCNCSDSPLFPPLSPAAQKRISYSPPPPPFAAWVTANQCGKCCPLPSPHSLPAPLSPPLFHRASNSIIATLFLVPPPFPRGDSLVSFFLFASFSSSFPFSSFFWQLGVRMKCVEWPPPRSSSSSSVRPYRKEERRLSSACGFENET